MSMRISVGGKTYDGWLSAEIERSLDDFAHRFSLGVMDRWASNAETWPIRTGMEAFVTWDDEVLITGHVNRINLEVDENDWKITVEGRSRTGDLADCSATHSTGHWSNKTASAIIADLIEPYGLTVSADVPDTERFSRISLREGETVHALIERLCKVRAVLPITKPDGGVRLFSALASTHAIKLDVENAISRHFGEDESQRFSSYLMRATGVGSDLEAFVKAQVADTGVKRFRPLVVVDDAPARTAEAKLRAQWEANVRAGRGECLSYVFQSPLNLAGKTYAPGQLYRVVDDWCGLDEVMIVRRATIRAGEEDLSARIDLVRPETFSQIAYPPKKLIKKTGRVKTRRGGLGL